MRCPERVPLGGYNMARARTLSVVGIATALAVPMLSGPAFADPAKGLPITLTCGSTTFQVLGVPGEGDFTPALDTTSNKVFIPHAFGEFTGSLYDANGVLVDSETDPATVQGSGKQKSDLSCTFTFSVVSDGSDPNGPPAGWTFTGTGTVTGQVAGH